MGFSQVFNKLLGSEKTPDKTDTPSVSSNELSHINQEMYKKSLELAETNKTLGLLEKINELILGSITNLKEIAKEVTLLLVNEVDFTIAIIFLYDKEKNMLQSLANSHNQQGNVSVDAKLVEVSLDDQSSFIVQAIKQKTPLFADAAESTYPEQLKNYKDTRSVFVAPLFVRGELIGALSIAMAEEKKALSEYRLDLLNRLVEVVGIGLDNAMLYNQVQAANDQLKIANQKLQELDKLKNEFVSVASHELRTPMTAIKSYLWMALNGKGGKLNEKQQYYIERGYNSTDRLIRLVNDMLNISRIESGRISIDLQSADIITLTQEVVEEVLPRANELEVTVTIQKTESLPKVLADSDKIKEVLFNLIGNSLKFTPKGGTITVSFNHSNGFIETKVVDNGSGIAPEDIGKLFQKFGLLPGSYITNQTAMGTGLGLYICRSIIDLHHGEIKAASEGRGKGATFTFTLKEFHESDMQLLNREASEDKKDKVDLIHVSV